MTAVITNENNIVQECTLIPGLGTVPKGWHCYFPVTESIPVVGDVFIPDLNKQPWLTENINMENIPLPDNKVKTGYPELDSLLDGGISQGTLVTVKCAGQETGANYLMQLFRQYANSNLPAPTTAGRKPAILFISFNYQRNNIIRDLIIEEDKNRVRRFRDNLPEPTPFLTWILPANEYEFQSVEDFSAWLDRHESISNSKLQAVFIDSFDGLKCIKDQQNRNEADLIARELRNKICLKRNLTMYVGVSDEKLSKEYFSEWPNIHGKLIFVKQQVDTELSVMSYKEGKQSRFLVKPTKHRAAKREIKSELHYNVDEDGKLSFISSFL